MSNDPESGVGSSAAGYSTTGGFGSEGMGSTNGTGPGSAGSNVWESRLGLRIDVLAALAYLGGPLAALLLLILETVNDYVRFHAFSMYTTSLPIGSLNHPFTGRLDVNAAYRILELASHLSVFSILYIIFGLLLTAYAAFRAFRDPNASPAGPGAQAQAAMMHNGTLPRFYLPIVGDLAERWVGDE
ncbi:hypothetical protein QFC24_005656 [Naganishia onofrii]|uniref:Uncharacterized protein n=1 Tax=Naganishia onofrii TaxID=1851511 RepID=A0ACC2X5W5_9TREE|nr:hypothetical protein QFC24_005656 [Naganishia onofrii]